MRGRKTFLSVFFPRSECPFLHHLLIVNIRDRACLVCMSLSCMPGDPILMVSEKFSCKTMYLFAYSGI